MLCRHSTSFQIYCTCAFHVDRIPEKNDKGSRSFPVFYVGSYHCLLSCVTAGSLVKTISCHQSWVAGSELIPAWAYQLYFMYLIFAAYKSLNCCPSLNIVAPGSAGIWAVVWGKRDPVLSWRSQQEEFYSFYCYQWGADLPLNFSVICLSCQVSSSFFDCGRLFHLFTAIFLSPSTSHQLNVLLT